MANHNPACDEAWCNKRTYLTLVSNPTPKDPEAVSPLSGNYGATRYHTHPWTPPAGIQWRTYYYAGTQRIAQRTWNSSGSTLNFLLSDHLGSTRQVIDADGNRVEEIQYKAWGESLAQTGSDATRRKYTGQVESEAGLYFYNARYYDPALSRFAQADTLVPNAGDPQAWDRYAYVNNNPVNQVDPTGHMPVSEDGGGNCLNNNCNQQYQTPRPPYQSTPTPGGISPMPIIPKRTLSPSSPQYLPHPTMTPTPGLAIRQDGDRGFDISFNVKVNIDWAKVDKIDAGIDLIGITADGVAIGSGLLGQIEIAAGAEAIAGVVETVGFAKSAYEVYRGDPSSMLLQQTTNQAERNSILFFRGERALPLIGIAGNLYSLYINLQPKINIQWKVQ